LRHRVGRHARSHLPSAQAAAKAEDIMVTAQN
jgi:hypothetical protein